MVLSTLFFGVCTFDFSFYCTAPSSIEKLALQKKLCSFERCSMCFENQIWVKFPYAHCCSFVHIFLSFNTNISNYVFKFSEVTQQLGIILQSFFLSEDVQGSHDVSFYTTKRPKYLVPFYCIWLYKAHSESPPCAPFCPHSTLLTQKRAHTYVHTLSALRDRGDRDSGAES